MEQDADNDFKNGYLEFMREHTEYDPASEKPKKPKKPKPKTPLEELMDSDDE